MPSITGLWKPKVLESFAGWLKTARELRPKNKPRSRNKAFLRASVRSPCLGGEISWEVIHHRGTEIAQRHGEIDFSATLLKPGVNETSRPYIGSQAASEKRGRPWRPRPSISRVDTS